MLQLRTPLFRRKGGTVVAVIVGVVVVIDIVDLVVQLLIFIHNSSVSVRSLQFKEELFGRFIAGIIRAIASVSQLRIGSFIVEQRPASSCLW
jgi:heme/copper-type cytochrome/quinol oxidase subunit 4